MTLSVEGHFLGTWDFPSVLGIVFVFEEVKRNQPGGVIGGCLAMNISGKSCGTWMGPTFLNMC